MNRIRVSAPGKLMLLGEHAVVYGYGCIVTSVSQRMRAHVTLLDGVEFELEAPDVEVKSYKKPINNIGIGDIPKGAKFVEIAIKNFYEQYPFSGGIRVKTSSEFSSQFGFGSSSASVVCVINALSHLCKKKLSKKEIFDMSYKTVLDVQGKGSGFDVAAAIYGGTLYFATGGKVIEPLKTKSLPLTVGYSGIKADTVALMDQVRELSNKYPKVVEEIYRHIDNLVRLAKKAIIKSDWKSLGELMNLNQGYLEALGVGSRKLSAMIYAASDAGAYGAKLSGAGGGDCMIALSADSHKDKIEKAIARVSAEVVKVETSVEGVRVE